MTNTWDLIGNSGTVPGQNFLGTRDAQPLVISTDAVERMRITPDGQAWFKGMLRIDSGHITTNVPNGALVLNAGPPDATNVAGIWFRKTTVLGNPAAYTDLMRVTADGNVGIGTVSPSARLSVVGPNAVEIIGTARSATLLTSGSGIGSPVNSETALASFGLLVDGANSVSLGVRAVRTSAGVGWPTTAIGLGMDVDNTVRAGAALFLHHNGNVGIGTSQPGAKLTVDGSVSVTALGTYSNIEFTGHPIEISTGYSNDDFNLFMGADRTNQLSYIQSGHHNIGKATLSLNPQGGNVGIGTYKPLATLEVNGDMTIRTTHTFADSSQITFYVGTNVPNSNLDVWMSAPGALGPILSLTNLGGGRNAAAAIDFYTYNPGEGVGPDHETSPSSRIEAIDDGNFANDIVFLSNKPGASNNGWVEGMRITSAGNVTVPGDIILTAGADCAEQFDVSGSEPPEPGTVVVIDEGGTLRESHNAYDKKVAGVVSGAGDYRHAILLDKRSESERRVAVALLGKVYCKVDAQYSPVEVGDLLTTSQTPGHAMKAVEPTKAFGAVIGKALRPLEGGQGLIPILITLQ